ncbi:MAG: ubiquitin-like small modifier protein 1 [Thermoanaerobaculia bacterium]
MSIVFVIPGPLREFTGGRDEVRVDAEVSSAGEALAYLWTTCPGVRDRVVNELGDVRQHVNIFIDGENIRWTDGLNTPVRDGAEIVILPALSGG